MKVPATGGLEYLHGAFKETDCINNYPEFYWKNVHAASKKLAYFRIT
jgi:hypothetical protein